MADCPLVKVSPWGTLTLFIIFNNLSAAFATCSSFIFKDSFALASSAKDSVALLMVSRFASASFIRASFTKNALTILFFLSIEQLSSPHSFLNIISSCCACLILSFDVNSSKSSTPTCFNSLL